MTTLAAAAAAPLYVPADAPQNKGISKEEANARIRSLKEARSDFEDRWKEIRDYQLPFLGCFSDAGDDTSPARRRDTKIIDSTCWLSVETFGAGIMSGLTPPSRQWFKLGFSRSDTEEDVEAMRILDERQKILEHFLHRSNFYNCIHACYMELPFGQAPIGIFASDETGIRFQNYTIGTYYLGSGAGGRVNTFARKFRMSASQIAEQFGEAHLPHSVRDALKNHVTRYKPSFDIWWLVMPNRQRSHGAGGNRNMPYASLYWVDGVGGDDFLYIGGFEEFPVPVARFQVNGTSVYGMGPGWFAEGDAKQIQVLKKDFLRAIELSVKPPMVGPSDLQRINLTPGAYVKENQQSAQLQVRPLFQVNTNIEGLAAEVREEQQTIQRHYYADMFLLIASTVDMPQKTAQEVRSLQQEKLQKLGPVVERLQDEFLSPIIERVYNILERRGAFPPIPEEIAERMADEEVKIEYISPLAQAQKLSGLVNIEQGAAFAAQIASVWPDAAKKIDPVGTVSEYFKLLGVPGSVQRATEDVEAMIAQEQQMAAQQEEMQAQMAMMQAAAPAAQAAKNLTEAAQDGNPALQNLMGITDPGMSSI